MEEAGHFAAPVSWLVTQRRVLSVLCFMRVKPVIEYPSLCGMICLTLSSQNSSLMQHGGMDHSLTLPWSVSLFPFHWCRLKVLLERCSGMFSCRFCCAQDMLIFCVHRQWDAASGCHLPRRPPFEQSCVQPRARNSRLLTSLNPHTTVRLLVTVTACVSMSLQSLSWS